MVSLDHWFQYLLVPASIFVALLHIPFFLKEVESRMACHRWVSAHVLMMVDVVAAARLTRDLIRRRAVSLKWRWLELPWHVEVWLP